MRKVTLFSPTFLSIAATAGVIITTISAIKATPKALRMMQEKEEKPDMIDILEVTVKCYGPTVILGAGTIACILGANVLNKKTQANLASAYALVDKSFKEYRNKLIELYGDDADKNIRETIAREHCEYHQIEIEEPDRKITFYEPYSKTFITRYEREIMDAEYHINRNFVLRGFMCVNEYLSFLGISEIPGGDDIGWEISDGYYWIDFEHFPKMKNGKRYYLINTVFGADEFEDYLA